MRYASIALGLACFVGTPAFAQLSINFGSPGVSIGINLPVYPTLQRIPGYPVYYSPAINSNYFFYDGLYWVFEEDNWYASSWYNGPWHAVDRFDVPVYILRVPVRYYRHAPSYFHGWRADAPPRWGERWGGSWEQRRSGWDRWDRKYAPAPAPLPTYQRQYSGNRYPEASQQATIQSRSYRYQPAEPVAQQHFQQQRAQVQDARQQAEQPRTQQFREARQPRQDQPTRQQAEASAQRVQQAPGQQLQRAEPRPQQAQASRGQPQAQERAGENRGQRVGQDKDQEKGRGREKD